MNKVVYILLILIVSVSCSTQRQLRKAFVGKPLSKIEANFGQPKTVIEKEGIDGLAVRRKLLIYSACYCNPRMDHSFWVYFIHYHLLQGPIW